MEIRIQLSPNGSGQRSIAPKIEYRVEMFLRQIVNVTGGTVIYQIMSFATAERQQFTPESIYDTLNRSAVGKIIEPDAICKIRGEMAVANCDLLRDHPQ